MNRKFRCGRLMITKDGILKKLDLEDGGGTRTCTWESAEMGFDYVHDRLQNLFNIDKNQYKTSLYDFRRHPLNINEYNTFLEYIEQNGLNPNSTVIYLCTAQVINNYDAKIMSPKSKDSPSTAKSSISTSSKLFQTSSTKPIVNESTHRQKEESNEERDDRSGTAYSFENSSHDLLNNMHNLIRQMNFDDISIQLFEYVSIIHGYVCAIIHIVKQKLQSADSDLLSANQSELKLYSKSFHDVSKIFQSADTLITLNEKSLRHLQQFPTVLRLFSQLYENFKILKKQLSEYIKENHDKNDAEKPSSSFISPVEFIPTILSNPPSENPIDNCHNMTVDQPEEQSQALPSEDVFDDESEKRFALFRVLLSRLTNLYNSLHEQNLPSFYKDIELTISEVKSLRSNINLSNADSVLNVKNKISSIKRQYQNIFNTEYLVQPQDNVSPEVMKNYKLTFTAMRILLQYLDHYRFELTKNNENDITQQSSTYSATPNSHHVQRRNQFHSAGRNSNKFQRSHERSRSSNPPRKRLRYSNHHRGKSPRKSYGSH